jgi:hypothetical protein
LPDGRILPGGQDRVQQEHDEFEVRQRQRAIRADRVDVAGRVQRFHDVRQRAPHSTGYVLDVETRDICIDWPLGVHELERLRGRNVEIDDHFPVAPDDERQPPHRIPHQDVVTIPQLVIEYTCVNSKAVDVHAGQLTQLPGKHWLHDRGADDPIRDDPRRIEQNRARQANGHPQAAEIRAHGHCHARTFPAAGVTSAHSLCFDGQHFKDAATSRRDVTARQGRRQLIANTLFTDATSASFPA